MLIVHLPDGKELRFDGPQSGMDVASSIGRGLAKAALAAEVDGVLRDMATTLDGEVVLNIVTKTHPRATELLRHSCAHIMAAAVGRLFPGVKFGIGPAIENGFYYDFDMEHVLTAEDFARIEAEMDKIVAESLPFTREEMPVAAAIEFFRAMGQEMKVELLSEIPDPTVTVYRLGDFADLCRGPHLPDSSKAPAFKLMSVAGAYWRGDVTRKMLQRIYAVAFADKNELKEYLHLLEEAKKRDHRVIGKQMDLFSFQDEGPGFPFFHPRGTAVINEIIGYWREVHRRHGYSEIITPTILSRELWERSGHYDNYRDHMYFTEVDGKNYSVKPMNCPGAMLIYRMGMRSYKDLPLRLAELGRVHRYELSGVMHGLFRVRAFSIDDAHIFCTPEQIEPEIVGVIDLINELYGAFGFKTVEVSLSTRPAKSIGSDEIWEKATDALRSALATQGLAYDIEEGGGAFYGPKIDFKVIDSIGRRWQCGTIQVDFSMPARFELEYAGADGFRHTPVLVHRAVLGSLERFFGILIEHTEGKFPLWLAPVQARVLTITDASRDYARQVAQQLSDAGIRVDSDLRNEKIGYKIRAATLENVPYMLVVGENEAESGRAALRHRQHGDLGPKPIEEIIAGLRSEVGDHSDRSFWK